MLRNSLAVVLTLVLVFQGILPAMGLAAQEAEVRRDKGGGSTLGAVFKWGCLLGAMGAGALAWSEKSSGDDAYDEYKDLFHAAQYGEADEEFAEAEDHDDKAVIYGAAAGGLFALFLLQQFVLGGGSDGEDQAALDSRGGVTVGPAAGLTWDPEAGQVRAALARIRF